MKKKEIRIATFSLPWFFWVAVAVIMLVGVRLAGSPLERDRQFSLVRCLSLLELVYLLVYKYALRYLRSEYNVFNELPCYLCNISSIICLLAAVSESQLLMAYCSSIGFLGAVLAYLMPDGPNVNQKFFSWQALGFYGYHSLLVASSLSFWVLGLYEPAVSDALKVTIFTVVIIMAVHLVNLLMIRTGLNPKSNFIFTIRPDNAVLAWFHKLNPVELWYLLPVAVPLWGLCASQLALLKLLSR
ncbi:MAG: YwaF family protein [Erysipelotrichaceae bacterium]|nr:YwaF family protein [Erysipelotrichaceae bacterium]